MELRMSDKLSVTGDGQSRRWQQVLADSLFFPGDVSGVHESLHGCFAKTEPS